MVFMTRGTQAPTIFGIWTALATISAIMRRSTWIEWAFQNFYANLYVFLVAMPALCGKSTIIGIAEQILDEFHLYLPDLGMSRLKKLKILADKITPESLFHFMQPDTVAIPKPGGGARMVSWGNEVLFLASDLPTMLGRQSFNEGLIGALTRLYDNPPKHDYYSVGHGHLVIPKPTSSFIAGVTMDSFTDMMPEQALGSGFVSRVTMVYAPTPTRNYSSVRYVKGAPTVKEMKRRLAWIVNNIRGQFTLDDGARERYESWHEKSFWLPMLKDPEEYSKAKSRLRVIVMKVALLMRANRYDPAEQHGGLNIIDEQDMADAIRIVDATYTQGEKAFERIGEDDYSKDIRKVERAVRDFKQCKIGDITRRTKIRKKGTNLITILNTLVQEGKVVVYLSGAPRSRAFGDPGEEFVWKEWQDRKRAQKK